MSESLSALVKKTAALVIRPHARGFKKSPAMCSKYALSLHNFSSCYRALALDDEMLYSICPEQVGHFIASKINTAAPEPRIVELFAGCGGLTLVLLQHFSRVLSVEIDASRIAMIRHNAALFGRSAFAVCADAFEYPLEDADFVAMAPPWGLDYDRRRFDVLRLRIGGRAYVELVQKCARLQKPLVQILPRSCSMAQLEELFAMFGGQAAGWEMQVYRHSCRAKMAFLSVWFTKKVEKAEKQSI